MQNEDKGIAIGDNEIEEILPKKQRIISAFLLIVTFLLLYSLGRLWLKIVLSDMNYGGGFVSFVGFIFIPVLLFYLLLFLLVFYVDITETLVISPNGVKYSTIFKKIDCEWKDISRIEVETHKDAVSTNCNLLHSSKNLTFHIMLYFPIKLMYCQKAGCMVTPSKSFSIFSPKTALL